MQMKEQLYILTLEKYRNISKAAEALKISQPALSTFLTNLERTLGTQLFNRSEKPMSLTDAGELYVQKARQMMRLKDEFDLELAKLVKGRSVRIHIGVQHIRAPYIVPPLMMAQKQNFPELEIIFHEGSGGDLYKMLKEGQLELMFSNIRKDQPGWDAMTLLEDHLLLVTPQNHPLAAKARKGSGPYPWIDLSLFREENFILLPEDYSIRYYMEQVFSALDWYPKRYKIYHQTEISLRMISAGFGIGFALESYLSYFNLPQPVRAFCIGTPPVRVKFGAIYPKEQYHAIQFRQLLELISFLFKKVSIDES